MADYGLVIKNLAGQVQIDSLYKNFCWKEGGSLNIVEGENELDFANVSQVPLIAIRPSTTTFCVLDKLFKSAAGDYTGAPVRGEIGESGTIEWELFIAETVNALPAYGLVVRNPSNEVVFSSNEKYLKIIDVHSFTLTAGYYNYKNITVHDANTHYFILYPYSYYVESIFIEEAGEWETKVMCMGCKKISATVIRVGSFKFWQDFIPEDATDSSGWFDSCKLVEVST